MPNVSVEYVAWQWRRYTRRPRAWSHLHALDPERPGFTRCGCVAGPVEGIGCYNYVYGVQAHKVASETCKDYRCGSALRKVAKTYELLYLSA
jgi:hypothetical protein